MESAKVMDKTKKWIKENTDLFLTIICLLLIIIAYFVQAQDNQLIANIIFLAAIIIGGIESAKEGIEAFIESRKIDANILMILAAVGACFINHFSEGAILIFIFSLSHSLERYTESKSRDAIAELMNMVPDTARKYLPDGSITEVETKDLQIGDKIQVPKGEMIPIDGLLLSKECYINEASITGESMPVYKATGETVIGGTLNVGESFDVEVSVTNQDTLMSKIVALVDEAQNNPSTRESLISKIEGIFVKGVLIFVPLFILATPFLLNWEWKTAFYRGMVMMTVASPCALVASASPAKLSAISRAAKQGMIIRGGNILDILPDIDTVVFDKTGTLTLGLPSVTNAYYLVDELENEINQIVKSAESTSTHPIANAFIRQFQNVDVITLDQIENITGKGFVVIHQENHWRIGNRQLIMEGNQDQSFSDIEKAYIENFEASGATIVFVTRNEQLVAFFGVTDPLKKDSAKTIQILKDQQIETVMLTGDAKKNSQYIGAQLGIDQVFDSLLPDDKLNIIKRLQAEGKNVLMVGDGVNDAPALAIADIGIAMGSGTDVAMETADIILVKNNLNRVPFLLEMAKKTSRIIKQNIVFSLAVILLLITINVLQIISLPIGVVAHEGSTICVILNGLRMLYFGNNFGKEEEQTIIENTEMIKIDHASSLKKQMLECCQQDNPEACLVQYGYPAHVFCRYCEKNTENVVKNDE